MSVGKQLERLYKRRTFGIKPGLAVEEDLMARLEQPWQSYGCIHIAGTNGKGSIASVIASVLSCSGYRTGLYTSPHLVRFNERISVDGERIEDEELEVLIKDVEAIADVTASAVGQDPTFFEMSTAMAMEYFRRKGVRFAVLETGMGGRLDATNVVTPLVSVISRIAVEHSRYLGADIETIAFEKCGIIKKGRPVVCGAMDEKARDVVLQRSQEEGCRFVDAVSQVSVSRVSSALEGQKVTVETQSVSYGTFAFPLQGAHQLENLAIAVAAVEVVADIAGLDIGGEEVAKAISGVSWPGRFQVLSHDPPIILDGAHNPNAGEALSATLREVAGGRPVGMVIGMCKDKEAIAFLRAFKRLVSVIWVAGIGDERNMDSGALGTAAKAVCGDVRVLSLGPALVESRSWASEKGGIVCITGSLYLVGDVLKYMEEQNA